jgi:Pumilio-family RNA binding repeat
MHRPNVDPFGNYLCQKLLEYSTDEQRNVICESVAQDPVNISFNAHASDHQGVQLVNEITYNALTLVQDPYGNYVSFVQSYRPNTADAFIRLSDIFLT